MKKLVSLLSAMAMLAMLAVPASAALTYAPDEDGWNVISEMPSNEEVAAYTPSVVATAQQFKTEDDLKAFGGSSFNKKYKGKLAGNDFFVVTYEVSNFGTLVSGCDEDYADAFFGIAAMNITYDGSELPAGFTRVQYSLVAPDGSTTKLCTGEGLDGTNLNTIYSTGVTAAEIMPPKATDEGQAVVDGTFKVQYVLYYPTQTEPVTLKYVGTKFDYKAVNSTENRSPINTAATGNDLTLGQKPEPIVKIGNIIEANGNLENGKAIIGRAWDVEIQNFDGSKTYVPTFTDKDTEEKHTAAAIGFTGAEVDGSTVNFVTLLRLSAERNVELSINY